MNDSNNSIAVLFVEDDPDMADVTASFLQRADSRFVIETVPDATAGEERLRRGGIDCVVSDYDMPGRNGIEFLKRVRQEAPKLPFILFTGKGSEEVASDAISAGVTDYLQKETGPGQFAVLANRVSNAVAARRSEMEVDRRGHRFEQAMKTVPVSVIQLDRAGRLVFANEPARDLLALSPPTADARTFGELGLDARELDGSPTDSGDCLFERIVESGESIFDARMTLLTGRDERKTLSVNGAPLFDDDGAVDGVIFTLNDITDLMAREEELRRTKSVLDHTEALANVGGWELDISGEPPYPGIQTAGLYRIHGRSLEKDFPLDAAFEYIHPEDRSRIERRINELLEDAEPFEIDGRIVTDQGDMRWVRSVGEPVVDDGVVVKYRGAMVDITQAEERQRELERQNERLDGFASALSHDLRTPLTVATSYLSLAREENDSELLEKIERAHDRIRALVEDVLTLAREGKAVTSMQPVDMGWLFEETFADMETGPATCSADFDARILADRKRLQRMLENLIGNALKHGGDRCHIRMGPIDGGFYFEDDGRGIPEDKRREVFEMGFSTSEKGTGFGLSIVHEIVQAHRWSIRAVESDRGGARFEISGVEWV